MNRLSRLEGERGVAPWVLESELVPGSTRAERTQEKSRPKDSQC